MIVFSLQKNKLWNGTGFIMKPGSLELSSMCFAEQQLNIGSGEYKIKLIGSSLSGNGICQFQILLAGKEIISRQLSFNNRANTETSFDINLNQPGPYTIKLFRGRESIGRMSIDLFTLFKTIEKITPVIENNINTITKLEKIFFIIDYDYLSSNAQISDLFVGLKDYSDCFFLLKTNNSNIIKEVSIPNYRLFFELEEIFDFLSLYTSKKVLYLNDNIDPSLIIKHGIADVMPVSSKSSKIVSPSGLIF